jgi:hypothetical protein
MKHYTGLIRPGDYIKHEKFMDVALYVTSVGQLVVGGSEIHISGIWWNQGFEKSYCINIFANITIETEKLSEWQLCLDPEINRSLRKCEWTPLAYRKGS